MKNGEDDPCDIRDYRVSAPLLPVKSTPPMGATPRLRSLRQRRSTGANGHQWHGGQRTIVPSDAPDALELFRKIIVASTSIPGEVSPVMIDVDIEGKHFQEMHVDGGAITQVFLYPPRILAEPHRTTGRPYRRELHAYLIRNGRLEPEWSDTERHTLSISMPINGVPRDTHGTKRHRVSFRWATTELPGVNAGGALSPSTAKSSAIPFNRSRP